MNVPKALFCISKTDIVWDLQKLGIVSEYKVPLNLKLENNVFIKVDDMINNSWRKLFLGSLDWFSGVKIDSEKSNFAYLKCMALNLQNTYNDFLGVCWFLAKNIAFRTHQFSIPQPNWH